MIVPPAGALAAALLAGVVCGWQVHGWKTGAEAAAERQAQEQTRREQDWGTRSIVQEVDRDTVQRERQTATLDGADRGELERLRLAAAAVGTGDTTAAGSLDAEQFSQCRSALVDSAAAAAEGAALARRLEAQAAGLRDYATGIGRVLMTSPP